VRHARRMRNADKRSASVWSKKRSAKSMFCFSWPNRLFGLNCLLTLFYFLLPLTGKLHAKRTCASKEEQRRFVKGGRVRERGSASCATVLIRSGSRRWRCRSLKCCSWSSRGTSIESTRKTFDVDVSLPAIPSFTRSCPSTQHSRNHPL